LTDNEFDRQNFTFFYPEFQQKNFSFIINILLDNYYPLEFLFSSVRKRLSVKFRLLNNHDKSAKDNKNNYFVIPNIEHSVNKFLQYFKNISNFKLAFYGINKLNKFIKIHKDPVTIHPYTSFDFVNSVEDPRPHRTTHSVKYYRRPLRAVTTLKPSCGI